MVPVASIIETLVYINATMRANHCAHQIPAMCGTLHIGSLWSGLTFQCTYISHAWYPRLRYPSNRYHTQANLTKYTKLVETKVNLVYFMNAARIVQCSPGLLKAQLQYVKKVRK